MKISNKIVNKLIDDLLGRSGVLDGIDKATLKEIKQTWTTIVDGELEESTSDEPELKCPFGEKVAKVCTPTRHEDCKQCDGRNK